MAVTLDLQSISKVLKNLQKEVGVIRKSSEKGLRKGLLVIQEESDRIVPVDKNILRSSSYRKVSPGGKDSIIGEVGYNTDYAVFVHEDLQARHKEGKEALFLEKAVERKKFRVLAEIEQAAKIR